MLNFFHKRKSILQHIRFEVPPPDPFKNPLVETHPGQLRQWAAGLPFANPQQLAEAVITSLSRLNRFPGPVKRREELMEIYSTPCTRLSHVSPEQKNPLSVTLKRQLMREMAYGYLHLVNSCLNEKPSAKLRRRLVGHIYFTIKYIALEYLFACEEYDCRINSPRKDLMRLYTLAEDINLQNALQDDPDTPIANVSHLTKLILLISLLDPCHLQKGESRVVFDYLNQFADTARFTDLDSSIETMGHYVVDRLGEVPPQLLDPDTIEGLPPPRFCLFDLLPISQQLHLHLRIIEQRNGAKPPGLQGLTTKAALNLLRRMLKSWHIRLQRDSERHTTSGEVQLTRSIRAIHHELSGTTPNHNSEDQEQETLSVTLEAGGMGNQSVTEYQSLNSWRFNQSRSGVALHLNAPLTNAPQVGEITLLTKPESHKQEDMKLGIIRRALLKEGSILELGVQFINGKIVPLSIQPLDAAEDQQPINLPALYIDLGSIERSALIIPRDLMQLGKEYRVEEMTPAPVITPVHLLETTATFERYRVTRVST